MLSTLLEAMQGADIALLVLKGPALASTIYSEPGLRPFGDLDLLCPRHQLAAADALLRQLGYQPLEQHPWEQDDFHLIYTSRSQTTVVELHADLLQLGLLTQCLPDLWDTAVAFQVALTGSPRGTVSAHMLGLEHQVLHLCVHLHTHGYQRLIWFKDLDLLLRARGSEVHCEVLWALARREGVTLSVRHALALLHALLATPLPGEALSGPRPDALGELAHAVLWPQRRVLQLEGKQRLRSLRFNPRLGLLGVIPSLVVLGRRREKLEKLSRLRSLGRNSPSSAYTHSRGGGSAWSGESRHAYADVATSAEICDEGR